MGHFSRVCAVIVLVLVAGCGDCSPAWTTYELPSGYLVISEGNRLQITSPDLLISGVLYRCEDSAEVCGEIIDLRAPEIQGFRYEGSTFPTTLRVTDRSEGGRVLFSANVEVAIVREMGQAVVSMHCAAHR